MGQFRFTVDVEVTHRNIILDTFANLLMTKMYGNYTMSSAVTVKTIHHSQLYMQCLMNYVKQKTLELWWMLFPCFLISFQVIAKQDQALYSNVTVDVLQTNTTTKKLISFSVLDKFICLITRGRILWPTRINKTIFSSNFITVISTTVVNTGWWKILYWSRGVANVWFCWSLLRSLQASILTS